MGFTEAANGVGRNDLGLASAAIVAEELAISASAVDGVGISGIRSNVAAFAGASGMPIAEGDGAVITAAQDVNAAAVLLRAVHVVGKFIVNGDVIELRGWLVVPAAPAAAAVHAHAGALIAAEDHPLRIGRIDPHGVIVIAAGSTLDGDKSFSRVGGAVDGNIGDVNRVRVFGIDIQLAEVPHATANARISSGAQPGLAAIIRLEKSAIFCIDQRIDALAVSTARNGQAHAPAVAFWKVAPFHRFPNVATI